MPIVPTTRHHVGDHGRRRLDASRAGPFQGDLPDCVALQHDGVERALHGCQRVVTVDERRPDANVDAIADERRASDQLHMHVERPRRRHVVERHTFDPLHVDPVQRHTRAERDRCEDRGLRRRIEAAHVLRRVRLREAEPLRLGQGVLIGAATFHRRE